MANTDVKVKEAFECDYNKLVVARSEALAKAAEIDAALRRREYLNTVIDNKMPIKIFIPSKEGEPDLGLQLSSSGLYGRARLL